jgi:uncharacterized RDD family membrane protein YckC
MFTLEQYRERYARSSSQELLDLLAVDAQSLTPAARQALGEEVVRRGLTPGMAVVESAGGADRPRRFIYPKAPLSPRLGAYLVDGAIAVGPVITAAIFNHLFNIGAQSPAIRAINYIATVAWTFYYSWTKDAMPNGQSIGKKMFGLMVVDVETDRPCTLGKSIGRGLVMSLLSCIPLLGWFVEPIAAVVNDDGRRLGDQAAGTQVISVTLYEAVQHELAELDSSP